MSFLQAKCPSCAGQVEFKSGSSIVVVCPFCRSALARTDRGLHDLGKVSEVIESESPLKVGLKGIWRNERFELTGRAQVRHDSGGFWDEWYATFSNGWVGWLAEAQGKFYLTFYQPLPEGFAVSSYDLLQVGQQIAIPGKEPLYIAEKGIATALGASGEIPYKLTPNERSYYADLQGANNTFGTIDFSTSPPIVFIGQEVGLADLGLQDAKPAQREARKVAAQGMGCPNCGGPINLQVPDKSERVTCPNCDSLLDASQGKLEWLQSLKPPHDAPQFDLQIGMKGTFADGKEMRIVGATVRSVTIEGIRYLWHEYLLYNPSIGFRWLVHSENHWNFVEPINMADVLSYGKSVKYDGKAFKIFQDANAVVEYVKGEFYWKVEAGETVRATDYINAPLMLSAESTQTEINWSKATYIERGEIEKAFGISGLPRAWNVAPNQPFTGGFYIKWGFALLGLLFIVSIFMIPLTGFETTVLNETLMLQPQAAQATQAAPQIAFSQPFELKARKNVRITATAPVNNSWAELDIDLVNENNDEVESVPIVIEYYQGIESGESWSEGGQSNDATMSSLAAGKYTLRLEGTWEKPQQQALPVSVKVQQNVTRGTNFICAFLLLLIVPVFSLIRKLLFESRRWGQSMFTAAGTTAESED